MISSKMLNSVPCQKVPHSPFNVFIPPHISLYFYHSPSNFIYSLLKALLASALQLVPKSMPCVFRFFITTAPYFQIPISLSFLLLNIFFKSPKLSALK